MVDLYQASRETLLDGVDALVAHRQGVIVVGAHAIYLRVGPTDISVAEFTADADLMLVPQLLARVPPIDVALTTAGFRRREDNAVGVWESTRHGMTIPVDLLVPRAVAPGKGRRAARIDGHDATAARLVDGLEGALVDSDALDIPSLVPKSSRTVRATVAGPAALLIAKLHKITDRAGSDRARAKDALDVLRLLQGTETRDMTDRWVRLRREPTSQPVADRGMEMLLQSFIERRAPGLALLELATKGLLNTAELVASCRALADDLLNAVHSSQ